MQKSRLIDFLIETYAPGARRRFRRLLLLVVAIPVILLVVFGYTQSYRNLTDTALSRREAVAYLAATALQEKFDHYVDLAVSLATRVRFRELVAAGKWEDAIQILKRVPTDFPVIDRVFLTDPAGTLTADVPSLPNVRGRNFAFRDWYRGVSQDWRPYVSEVYQRQAEPQYKVIAVAAPIQTDDGRTLGILALQLRLDALLAWARQVDVGGEGFVYFVDQHGHAVGHPAFPPQGAIIDFRDQPVARHLAAGRRGVLINDAVTAYAPLAAYGWGVVVDQPAESAFATRNAELTRDLIAYAVLVIFAVLLAAFIVHTFYSITTDAVLSSIGEGMIITDRAGTVVVVNPAAQRMLGWKLAEVRGKSIYKILRVEDERGRLLPRAARPLNRAVETGRTLHSDSYYYRRSDGLRFPVATTKTPVIFRGAAIGVITLFRDVTREREIDKAKTEFVTLASHQMRTPLSIINWYAERLVSGAHAPGRHYREYAEKIYAANRQMVELITTLLHVSRIELGTLEIAAKPTDVAQIVRSVVEEFALPIEQKGLRFTVDIPDRPKAARDLMVDPNAIRIILQNLVSNAVKYTPDKGTVRVLVSTKPHELHVEVTDNGIGIPEHQRDLVFTKLFRADNAKAVDPEGTGLGLYMVKSFADRVGGDVTFTSEVGRGSTFLVTLPIIRSAKPRARKQKSASLLGD